MKKNFKFIHQWLCAFALLAVGAGSDAYAQNVDATINCLAGYTSNNGVTISGSFGPYGDFGYICQASSSITIAAPEGKEISKIVLTEHDGYRSYGGWVVNVGETSYAKPRLTWDGKATSVTFSNPSANDMWCISKVEVWFVQEEVLPPDPGPDGPDGPDTPDDETTKVSFSFKTNRGVAFTQDGVRCETNGLWSSYARGFQVGQNKSISFEAPTDYYISGVELLDAKVDSYYNLQFLTCDAPTFSISDDKSSYTWSGASRKVTITNAAPYIYSTYIGSATVSLRRCPLGDVNNDLSVDADDVLTLTEMLINHAEPTLGSDIDSDGGTSIHDVTTLIEMLLAQ